jgi:hypothetical protein
MVKSDVLDAQRALRSEQRAERAQNRIDHRRHERYPLLGFVPIDNPPCLRRSRKSIILKATSFQEGQIKSVPYAPVSHPFVERLIGTLRHEYLDHLFFWSPIDLTRKLEAFADYCNAHRVHRSLDGTTPAQRANASTARACCSLPIRLGGALSRPVSHTEFQPEYEFATDTIRRHCQDDRFLEHEDTWPKQSLPPVSSLSFADIQTVAG